MKVLDHGSVEFIEGMGTDERIIEAARMSTGGGFKGWGPFHGADCKFAGKPWGIYEECFCTPTSGDEKLLAFLFKNNHTTPFEMCEAVFEIEAPLFVFREWHRHRTQSYNEASARYIPLPDKNYMPTLDRIKSGVALAAGNRQAQGAVALNETWAAQWLERLAELYDHAQSVYELGINSGIPKELARLPMPVARYSKMRAKANLLNWIKFLKLRSTRYAPGAQWEIRQYADAIETLLSQRFPRTMALYRGE